MTDHRQTDSIADVLAMLEDMDHADQRAAIARAVIDTGGTWLSPQDCSAAKGASHLVEIALFSVVAYGETETAAIRNWIRAARAQIRLIEDDGFITVHPPFNKPRNHAEEIANARAAERMRAAQ